MKIVCFLPYGNEKLAHNNAENLKTDPHVERVYFILDDGKDGYEIYCSPAMQEMMIPE